MKATKATMKRLSALADGSYCDSDAYTLLRAVGEANEDAKVLDDCQKYDAMDEYNRYWGYEGGRAYYSLDGLVFRPTSASVAHRLAIQHPDLVRYLCTHDLNMVIIRDINRLVRALAAG